MRPSFARGASGQVAQLVEQGSIPTLATKFNESERVSTSLFRLCQACAPQPRRFWRLSVR